MEQQKTLQIVASLKKQLSSTCPERLVLSEDEVSRRVKKRTHENNHQNIETLKGLDRGKSIFEQAYDALSS